MGCLLALFARVALLVLWTQTQLINRAFHGFDGNHFQSHFSVFDPRSVGTVNSNEICTV